MTPRRRLAPLALALALPLGLGCERIEVGPGRGAPPPAAEPSPPAAEPSPPDPGDAPCETLDRAACLRSLLCTLEAPRGGSSERYLCRPAEGNCEVGLTQTEADVERCEQRRGCRWARGACYCPCRGAGRTEVEDGPEARACECACSGGPPPGCRRR